MKKLKYFLLSLLLIPCLCLFSGCSLDFGSNTTEKYVISIVQTSTTDSGSVYTIKYNDGTSTSFTVENGSTGANGESGMDGADGESLNIEDIYASAVEHDYTGTFLEFLEEYLTLYTTTNKTELAVNKALLSAVKISCVVDSVKSVFSQETRGMVDTPYQYTSNGAGVIYQINKEAGDAYIITNYHVVYSSDSTNDDKISSNISLYLYGGEYTDFAISATFVGGSISQDIAVLKIKNSDILKNSCAKQVDIANSDEIVVGETTIAVGNPDAEGLSATTGIVSVDSEKIKLLCADDVNYMTLRCIRTDASVIGGNSGGGLFNDDGKLIGIVNAKSSSTGINYAIPSNVAIAIADRVIEDYLAGDGSSVGLNKCVLGLTTTIDSSKAVYDSQTLLTSIVENVCVQAVEQNSISASMGFAVGDVITSVKIGDVTYDITRNFQLGDLVLTLSVGDTIKVNISREVSGVKTNLELSHTVVASDMVDVDEAFYNAIASSSN